MNTIIAVLLAASAGRAHADRIDYEINDMQGQVVSLEPGGGWSAACEDSLNSLRRTVPSKDPRLVKAKKCVVTGRALYVRGVTLINHCQEISNYLLLNDDSLAGSEANVEYKQVLREAKKCVNELSKLSYALKNHWSLIVEVRNNRQNYVEK